MSPIDYVDYKTAWEDWKQQHSEIVKKRRKIILRQGQSPGDVITFTRSVGDLKESYPNYQIDVRSPCPEVWENNPRLTPLKDDDLGVETFTIGYDEINQSGWNGLHFSDAFRHDLEKKLKIPIKKTGIRPEIWISDQEKGWYGKPHCEFGWDGPYWVLNAGRKPDNELKQYHRYQEFVDLFNETFKGVVKLVQIGHPDHIHPNLNGVLDLKGKTNLRELIRLCYWAQGTIGPLSIQFVISAAFEQPAVVLAAGKEGVNWHIYPHMRYIYTNGALECCRWGGCWLGGIQGRCKDLIQTDKGLVPKCFEMIKPYMINDAVKWYYEGGRLKLPTEEENKRFQEDFESFKRN